MTKVLIATEKPFAPVAVKGITDICKEAGFEVVLLEKYTSKAELLAAVADVHAIIIRSDIIDAEVFDAAKRLKIVVRAGAGYDNVDLTSATAHNVVVMNTPGQNANAVAELVIGMLLFGVRNRFNGTSGSELMGKRLGLLAFGATGRNVARIAQGLGMEVYAFDPFTPAEAMAQAGVKHVATQAELFAGCDIISMHIPATPETKGSIGRALVGSMPKKAILVNTARKEIINEAELLDILKEREDYIPRGFAHGFLTITEHATLQYKVDNAYHPESECSIKFDDPDLGIDWASTGIPREAFVLSAKDLDGISFCDYQHRSI